MKGFLDRAFCCPKSEDLDTVAEPAGIYRESTTESKTNSFSTETSENRKKIMRRHSAVSFKSCNSSIGSYRSLSCSSLQSTTSRNYDYKSIYSTNSGRASFNSCSS